MGSDNRKKLFSPMVRPGGSEGSEDRKLFSLAAGRLTISVSEGSFRLKSIILIRSILCGLL